MKQNKKTGKNYITYLIIISSLVVFACIMVTSAQADSMSSSKSVESFFESAGSALSISSSSSTQTQSSGSSSQSPGVKDPYNGLITENRLFLAIGQHSQHLIRFDNYGQVQALAQTGTTFDLYGKKGGIWPNSSTFKNDYDQKIKITDQEPVVMNVSPGIWVFTIYSQDHEGSLSMGAFQNPDDNSGANENVNEQTSTHSSSVSYQSV
jgi:hypothetical protein